MGLTIRGITALRTKMPLIRPYHLSLVTLDNFDSVLVRIQVNGKEGFGETTDVPGYFHETPEDAWNFIERWAPAIVDRQADYALQEIIGKERPLSFAATPLLTALEEIIHALNEIDAQKIRIPLLGIVQGESIDDLVDDTEKLQDLGFSISKSNQLLGYARGVKDRAAEAPAQEITINILNGYIHIVSFRCSVSKN